MTALFSTPKPARLAPPQTPPGLTDPQTRDNAFAQSPNPSLGYGSTILTSGQGAPGSPDILKKQLTGGS